MGPFISTKAHGCILYNSSGNTVNSTLPRSGSTIIAGGGMTMQEDAAKHKRGTVDEGEQQNEGTEPVAMSEDSEAQAARIDARINQTARLLEQSLYEEAEQAATAALREADALGLDVQKGRALNVLGNIARRQNNYTEALELYDRALELFSANEDHMRCAIVYGNIGLVYKNRANYSRAIECYHKALDIDEQYNNEAGMARHMGNIANVYLSLANYPMAIQYFYKALHLCEELELHNEVATHSGNLGTVYLMLSNFTSALEYFNKALSKHEELDDKLGVATTSANIGGVYFHTEDFAKSKTLYRNALEVYRTIGSLSGAADVLANLGLIAHSSEEYDEALRYQEQALEMNQTLGNVEAVAFNLSKIGALYAELRYDAYNPEKAESNLLEAVRINQEIGAKQHQHENYLLLATLYEQTDEVSKAYSCFKKYHELEKEIQREHSLKVADQLVYERKVADQEKSVAVERARTKAMDDILANMLPKNITERLISGEKRIADVHPNVTVLFIDIVGFTQLSATLPAIELVELLDTVFKRFDVICQKHGLEKIKTIGDAYMAVCGAPVEVNDHALRSSLAALEMLEEVDYTGQFSLPVRLEYRIGLHTGSVVAGILGENKYTYDLWGDAVNMASRMESQGESNKIHVSADFMNAVIDQRSHAGLDETLLRSSTRFHFEDRGLLDIKGKGVMSTYFLHCE